MILRSLELDATSQEVNILFMNSTYTICDNTVCICMTSLLSSQVRVLIVSGKFLWRAGTVWYRFKMKDLIHQSGFILMRVNQEKHRRPKLHSLKGRNNQSTIIHLRCIVT